jgi:hypothetical protein
MLYPRTGRYWAWYGTVTVGVLLVLWLSLQGLFIGFRWPMQYATGSMALSIVLLAFTPSVREFYTDSHEARRVSRLVADWRVAIVPVRLLLPLSP